MQYKISPNKTIGAMKCIENISVKGLKISVVIDVSDITQQEIDMVKEGIETVCSKFKRTPEFILTKERTQELKVDPNTSSSPFTHNRIKNVKNVVAVASGKGGVGKSTCSYLLALAFKKQGLRVGILDLDIYGPSLPQASGIHQPPVANPENKLIPHDLKGIQLLSIGFMISADQAMIWRGPVVQKAVQQLMFDSVWGTENEPLDILILDLPPGTGDVQLTLTQKLNLDGAVIVSTPQDLARIDARKAVAMFKKMEVPVWGMIENMQSICCPGCGHEFNPFGVGGVQKDSDQFDLPFLGGIPLSMPVREALDKGNLEKMLSAQHKAAPILKYFEKITEKLSTQFNTL